MERTIYSKFSNERAERFAIRTDIVLDEGGAMRVYKYAGSKAAGAHIAHIGEAYRRLTEAYAGAGPERERPDPAAAEAVCGAEDGAGRRIRFCPCRISPDHAGAARAEFPFLQGVTLQELLERAAGAGEREQVSGILREYIRRIREGGGERPFRETEEFRRVFGDRLPDEGGSCALAGDIDLIFSNILLTGRSTWDAEADWDVIDYEWTFDFPVPKEFLLYRALYFAYYQVLCSCGWSLEQLCAMAGIGGEAAATYARMEEHFQEYIRMGALPVRNMQRSLGTKIIPLADLISGENHVRDGRYAVPESEWIRVRRIQYHIDREECQDGSIITSGWALARAWDGRTLPVNIRVTGAGGEELSAEISRRERRDVAEALKIRNVTSPLWGFDCVRPAGTGQKAVLRFSLGRLERVCGLAY